MGVWRLVRGLEISAAFGEVNEECVVMAYFLLQGACAMNTVWRCRDVGFIVGSM